MAQAEKGGPARPEKTRAESPSSRAPETGASTEARGSSQEPPSPKKGGGPAKPAKPKEAKAGRAAKGPKPKPPPLTRSEVMSRIKSANTKPELMVRKALWAEGFRYRLHDKRLPGKPDLALRGLKTAVFVHGCFWHAHENCPSFRPPKSRIEYWAPKLERNKARDLEARRKLEAEGWTVVTIWECQLAKPGWLESLTALLRAAKNRAVPGPPP